MDEKRFNEINGKFDLAITLLALNLVKDVKTQKEKIITLAALGLKPIQIAKLLGTTPNTVSVSLSEVKKKGIREEPTPKKTESGEGSKQEKLVEGGNNV